MKSRALLSVLPALERICIYTIFIHYYTNKKSFFLETVTLQQSNRERESKHAR